MRLLVAHVVTSRASEGQTSRVGRFRDMSTTPIMENQMEKKMENAMDYRVAFRDWEFPNIKDTFFGGPHNMDCSIFGSILGSLHFGKLPFMEPTKKNYWDQHVTCAHDLGWAHSFDAGGHVQAQPQCDVRRPAGLDPKANSGKQFLPVL